METICLKSVLKTHSSAIHEAFVLFLACIATSTDTSVFKNEMDMLDGCIEKIKKWSHIENVQLTIAKLEYDKQQRVNILNNRNQKIKHIVMKTYADLKDLHTDIVIQFSENNNTQSSVIEDAFFSIDNTIDQCKTLVSGIEKMIAEQKMNSKELNLFLPECKRKQDAGYHVSGMANELKNQQLSNEKLTTEYENQVVNILRISTTNLQNSQDHYV